MPAAVPDPDEWYTTAFDLPRPKWEEIDDWITVEVEADLFDEAWDTVATNWLHRTAEALDERYLVAESPNFLLLAPHNESECMLMLTGAERVHTRITTLLGELCSIHYGRISVLRLTDEHYRQYNAYFHGDDGPEPTTSGLYIHGAYPHIACRAKQTGAFHRILAHEMGHFCTGHLRLPTWISEGIAMSLESDGRNPHLPDQNGLRRQRDYWNPHNVQDFWSGASWGEGGPGFSLSYGLAAMLYDAVQTEIRPEPENFRDFLREANRRDAGAAAAHQHLGADLGEMLGDILGPGDWEPQAWR